MASSFCLRCGKPLSLPESVGRSIGPVCAAKIFSKDKTMQTSMFRADYEFEIIDHPTLGRIIIIEDLDQGSTSVTNDMENVLRDIMHLEGVDIEHCKITYKDSMGNWDEVQVSRKGGIGFVSHQQAKTYQRVIDRWMQQHKTEQQ